MKRICVVHGVGFASTNSESIKKFCADIEQRTGAEVQLYKWQHSGEIPDDPERDNWLFKPVRRFVQEVIMDYTYVMKKMPEILAGLPSADFYVGNSAGSIIVASGTGKPQVLMASPWQLVQNVGLKLSVSTTLNIMYYRDPVAAPILGVRNVVVDTPRRFFLIDPLVGHLQYWDNPAVVDLTADWYHKMVE